MLYLLQERDFNHILLLFLKSQQKLPCWAESLKPGWNEVIIMFFLNKKNVDFLLKALMPYEVIEMLKI